MDKNELEQIVEVLSVIQKQCSKSVCKDCKFKGHDTCIFFNQPWNWDIANFADKL